MLSRVADSLIWHSRYIERAENLARLVAVSDHDSLDSATMMNRSTAPALYAAGAEQAYAEALGVAEMDELEIGNFIAFSELNPDSIRTCIAHARENARMVRDQISDDMWLECNRFHLYVKSEKAMQLWKAHPDEFYNRVIKFCLLYQGLTDSTILHDEGWHFVLLGRYLERVDKTSRIIDMLHATSNPDRAQLISVLSSCSGFSAFRTEYRGDINLENVVSFLLFSQSFPRSIRFCLRQLDDTLHAVSGMPNGSFSNEAERLTGSLLAKLNYTSLSSIWEQGLHQFIDALQSDLNEIGQQIFETYVLLAPDRDAPPVGAPIWQQYQQQQQQQQ
ncbi:alpha-E domain-containing protein [Verrucomicrobiaceae bacterium 5K15]|uniref:Alpha-E domain-containing protein n=1 Tax=Oceaniferula flava TaxID=2800421 RepID=A0AAE2SA42_9BACT|nr:alpha-E domain-containing protein [Oceaniferula flavus]MBK1854033.1 alpha-E domain-containing protein [Oceaniferula flavus]MBM1135339.1 alpha-E domain-containing protein [Oceaniferula flavus]